MTNKTGFVCVARGGCFVVHCCEYVLMPEAGVVGYAVLYTYAVNECGKRVGVFMKICTMYLEGGV